MKLSCLPVSFFPDIIDQQLSVAEWARLGVKLGLDAIDLSILFVPDRSMKTAALLRRQIQAEGIHVTMLTTYPDFTHPDKDQRKKELVLEADAVAIAAELGASLVRVTAGQAHPETHIDEGIEWAVEGLTQLVENTRSMGVELVYENHAKPGVWNYTDFSQPPEIFLQIVKRTAEYGLGVNFDTGNATAYAQNPIFLLNQVLPRVVSIHASDTSVKGDLHHVLLGSGVTPFKEIFSVLKQYGWDGWICMEEASFQGESGIEAAAEFIRKTWDES